MAPLDELSSFGISTAELEDPGNVDSSPISSTSVTPRVTELLQLLDRTGVNIGILLVEGELLSTKVRCPCVKLQLFVLGVAHIWLLHCRAQGRFGVSIAYSMVRSKRME